VQAQPSGTLTLVFTDIEGSTRLLSELGRERYRDALTEHRERIRDTFGRFDGYEVDYEGDSFFYAFQSATSAVSAVSAGMAALSKGPIKVRVGIHTGEPGLDPPKYVGMDVHRAARIMACAHGGQAVLSQATRELLEDSGGLRDLGEHRLKDLSSPVRLYQLGDGDFPPLRSLYRSNLPVPATPFLGRERELDELAGLLESDDLRLLTLTGPGGTGKTRLALQAAAEAADQYPDGVWWVPLAPLRDPTLVLPAVAQALELTEQPGRDLAETIAEGLTGKRLLLLLDNAEHLLPRGVDAIVALREIEALRLLVTTRERLQLAGEQLYPVPALADSDAASLFMARARQLDPAFQAVPEVATLCARLDNLPLAIELAAAHTSLFAPQQLLERLGQRLDLLTGGRDADPRQETLNATIDWSYQLLDAEERRVLQALSVFAGGCTLEAAEQICETDSGSLQSLLDKSLLRRRDGPRYWMLETVRQFAVERLHEAAGFETIADRHAAWFHQLVMEVHPVLVSGAQARETGRERLRADGANINAAFEWRLEHDDGRCVGLGFGVSTLWMAAGLNERAWRAGHRALGFSGPADERDRALLMCAVAACAFFQGEFGENRALAADAVTTLRAVGPDSCLAWALELLGGALLAEGDSAGALAALDESVEIARRCEPPWPLAQVLNDRANLALESGDLAGARELLEEAVRISQAPVPLTTLAEVALAQDRIDEARTCLARSIELSGGHLLWLCAALVCQAAVEEAASAYERAVTLLGAADRIGEESGAVVSYGLSAATQRRVSAVRALAASEEWRFAWEAGRAMSTEEAIACARGPSAEPGDA
jgi:predicted ATPase